MLLPAMIKTYYTFMPIKFGMRKSLSRDHSDHQHITINTLTIMFVNRISVTNQRLLSGVRWKNVATVNVFSWLSTLMASGDDIKELEMPLKIRTATPPASMMVSCNCLSPTSKRMTSQTPRQKATPAAAYTRVNTYLPINIIIY